MGIIERNKDTQFGRKHGFASIRTLADYRASVPVCRYDYFAGDIDRIARGETNVLTAEPVIMFATTSGTTDRPKLIPVTTTFYREFRAIQKIWTWHILRDHPEILRGKFLTLISPEESERTVAGIPCGSMSGMNYRQLARVPWQGRFMCVPYEVFTASDVEAKYYTVLRLALAADVSLITIINPSTILMLCSRLERHAESLIKDVRDGTLVVADRLEPAIRATLKPLLKPDPARADFLRREIGAQDVVELRRIWPRLALVNCWTASSAAHYVMRLKPHLTGLPIRDLGFNASEGYFSIPCRSDSVGGEVAVSGHFLEFIPYEPGSRDADGPALTCDRLEAGRCYRVVTTNSGGLYRYDMRDVVRVLEMCGGVPTIEFMHRADNVVSTVGEKVTELQIVLLVKNLCERHGLEAEEFFATVVRGDTPQYVLAVEGCDGTGDAWRAIEREADEELKRINIEYRAKRDSLRLGPMQVRALKSGSMERYRQRRLLQGAHDGQLKMLHLVGDPDFINDFDLAGSESDAGGERR